ncbi:hypothetical protein V6N12_003851 [Hibiscus sabdariffa]|uniref:Peptidase A1 domain-containing protein n=1 Tax=Hibiscus sabdariffa TaxID=183260 RepID=A0ABR2CJQ9_9ROSI
MLLFHHPFSFSASSPTGLSLRASVDDSPGSPLYRIESLSIDARIQRFINITNARASYLHMVRVDPDSIRFPVVRDAFWYAVEFTIGSQQHRVKLLLDTGSGLTWTQCLPCQNCFPQRLPIFNPRSSTSYALLSCDHPLCQGTDSPFECEDGRVCVYNARYAGGSFTGGLASVETFHFPAGQHRMGSYPDIIYGCSHASHAIFFQNTDVSGIFGLSKAPESFITQFSASRFSYCFAPFDNALPHPLILKFRDDVPRLPPPLVRTTLFVQVPGDTHFHLELLDISVAQHRIGFPADTFQVRPDRTGGCIIDSGALITVIDANTPGVNAYVEVMRVFEAYYGSKGLVRIPPRQDLELCYQLPPTYKDFATLTFHFNGADYTVAGKFVNIFFPDSFCVAILDSNFATMLGAWQQQNKRIIHDLGMGALQFSDEICINDVGY